MVKTRVVISRGRPVVGLGVAETMLTVAIAEMSLMITSVGFWLPLSWPIIMSAPPSPAIRVQMAPTHPYFSQVFNLSSVPKTTMLDTKFVPNMGVNQQTVRHFVSLFAWFGIRKTYGDD